MLIKQQKTTIKPPFDPILYDVTEVKGSQVTARRGDKTRIRSRAKVKLLKKRPEHLVTDWSKLETQLGEEEDEEDYTFINLSGAGNEVPPAIQPQQEDAQGQPELPAGEEGGAAVQQRTHAAPRREEWVVANGPWREKLSPRERKRRQMAARNRDKGQQRDRPYQLRSRGIPRRDEGEELV